MTPELANALIYHFAQKYLADILPNDVFTTIATTSISDNTKNKVDDWDNKVSMLHHWEQVIANDPKKEDNTINLSILKQALFNNQKVWLGYEGRDKKFQFNIFGLVMRDQQFFIVGSYWGHQEPFLLSIRKITSINLTEEDALKPDADFDGLQAYANHHLNHTKEDIIESLEIEFPIHLLSYIQAYPLCCDELPEIDDHGDYFTLRAKNILNSLRLQQWLSGFHDEAHIIHPIHLRKIINRSFIDKLTNLYNRHFFDRLFQREIQRYFRDQNYCFSILALDIDYFKRINDSYGHDTGDQVLKLVADELREYDAIRFGGEEFNILLADTQAQDAYNVAERIRLAIAAANLTVDTETIKFTVSIGIAGFPEHLPNKLISFSNANTKPDAKAVMDSILKQADNTLIKAKNTGRNQCLIATGIEK